MTTGKDIARGIKLLYTVMHRQAQGLLQRYDVTADQYVLLAHLSVKDGITQNELAKRALSDPNTIRAMLVLMESKGLVVRKPDEADRRARRVVLTAKGRRLCAKLVAVLKPLQDAMLSPFNQQEAEQLVKCFRRIEGAIRRWELEQKSFSD